ncbi:MAG TPA: FmdB family zinc ribbon protein [Ornithinicoccus sp.]|nr:FmdB family zinc ribbon protein [Ornithinicoccus sp.]
MPTYSYACKDCDNAFDIQQAFSDDALTLCPECGGTLRKRYGSVGVVFKGSGFYRTDSRKGAVASSKSPASAGATTSAESSTSGSSSESSSTGTSSTSTGTSSTTAASTGPATAAASA